MSDLDTAAARALAPAFGGDNAHVSSREALAGLPWTAAGERPAWSSHTIFQVVCHLRGWQDAFVRRLDGETAPAPPGNGWTADPAPAGAAAWDEVAAAFQDGGDRLAAHAAAGDLGRVVDERGTTALEALRDMASHNAYHFGEIVALRRALGCWPPHTPA